MQNLRVEFPAGKKTGFPVRDVSFTVDRQQSVGIVGESGSGKSLTALSIMRLIPHPGRLAAGKILLESTDLASLSERQMAAFRGGEVAMIYQNPLSSLNPLRTVGSQISEAIRAHRRVGKGAALRAAVDLLGDVGIASPAQRVNSYPHEFSGGMRQRVMIAMALSTEPGLLIADEPTTALDVTTQARIMDLLRKLTADRHLSVLLITHDLAIALNFCDEINVMYAGRIVENASAQDMLRGQGHPYSAGLLSAVCTPETDVNRPLKSVAGLPPSSSDDFPAGCAFHPRCPIAIDVCQRDQPPSRQMLSQDAAWARQVECHRAEVQLATAFAQPQSPTGRVG